MRKEKVLNGSLGWGLRQDEQDFQDTKLVENKVLLELKANQTLVPANEVQLVNYLTATGIELGLLPNFGAVRLEFKRKTKTYRSKPPPNEFIV